MLKGVGFVEGSLSLKASQFSVLAVDNSGLVTCLLNQCLLRGTALPVCEAA